MKLLIPLLQCKAATICVMAHSGGAAKHLWIYHFVLLLRNKKSLAVNLKHQDGVNIVKKLCGNADILIEGYRPGVMEKLGLGPDVLCKLNSRLIYARLTGFGQSGPLALKAGHDINYLAVSGILSVSYKLSFNSK